MRAAIAVMGAGLAVAACAHGSASGIADTYTRAAVRRGTYALLCPEYALATGYLGGGGVEVRGCGQTQTYTCTTTVVSMQHDVVCQPDGPPTGVHVDPPPPPAGTGGEALADVPSVRAGVASCGLPASTVVSVYVGVDGDVLRVETPGASDAQGTCAYEGLRSMTFPRTSDATHFAFAIEEPAPTATTAMVAPASDTDARARAAVDALRDGILACNGGAAVAVVAEWTAEGAMTVHLPDARAGTPEDGCVRATVGSARIDPAPGVAGSVLHALH